MPTGEPYVTDRAIADSYAEEIRRGQEEGTVAADVRPELPARIIMAAWDGLQIQWLNNPAFDIAEAMREVMSSLLNRTGSRPAA